MPPPRKRVTFWLDEHHTIALKAIKQRDGVPEAEQLRRALDAWINERKIDARATTTTCKPAEKGVRPMKVGIYARVSKDDQEPENQLQELRRLHPSSGLDSHRVRR